MYEELVKSIAIIFCNAQIPPIDEDAAIPNISCPCAAKSKPLSQFCAVPRKVAEEAVNLTMEYLSKK